MNRFEQAVHDCMFPTARLLERTSQPLHRAILLNFWRHVHLQEARSGARGAVLGARRRLSSLRRTRVRTVGGPTAVRDELGERTIAAGHCGYVGAVTIT